MSIKFIQLQACSLESFINNSSTSFQVAGFLYNDGITPVAPADIGDICFATLEPRTERMELISFTIDSVTAAGVATLTVIRGLSQRAPYGTGGATFEHQAGSKMVISNNPGLLNELARKDGDEIITGNWTFNTAPSSLSPTPATTTSLGNVKLSAPAFTNLGVTTITIATPGVVSRAAHGLIVGDSVQFTTTGALPTGFIIDTNYFVIAAGLTAGEFRLSLTVGGAAINTTGSQSGIHTLFLTTPIASFINPSETQFISATTGMISMYAGAAAPTGFLLCDGAAVSRTTFAALFAVAGTTYGVGDGSTTFNVPDLRSSFPVGQGQKTKTFTFIDANVNVATDVITVPTNEYLYTGQQVALTTSGVLPAGLSATNYFIIRVTATTIKLATSRANADDDVAVNITAAAGGGTHTLTLTLTNRVLGTDGGEESHALSTEELASHTHTAFDDNVGSSGSIQYIASSSAAGRTSAEDFIIANGGDTPHNNMPPFVVINYIIKT